MTLHEQSASNLAPPAAAAAIGDAGSSLVASESPFLRFVAGMRALLAVLVANFLFAQPTLHSLSWLVLPYLGWAAVLLWKTLAGWPHAGSRLWPWIDTAALLLVSQLTPEPDPLLGALTVLPVVALALLDGVVHATALAVTCAAALLVLTGSNRNVGAMPPLPLSVPFVLLAFGPAAALLARPSRDLRQRMQLLDRFNARLDPRQGLRHHVDVLLELLAAHFHLAEVTISLQGPQPRIFQWQPHTHARELAGDEERAWREHLAALPRNRGGVCLPDGAGGMPLMSYGQPLGYLVLRRDEPRVDSAELRWLEALMRETLPLLERSDLLEQLQRENASRERERIGRDLHDSAVQPYLGLKYGLEALARNAGPDNPITPGIQQLLGLATQELQTLRDVVSGLRCGDDPTQPSATLVALHRQVERFQALYGLSVHVVAPRSLHLRGSAAKAILHMVNEALTNVRRHTSAKAVTVQLDVHQDDLMLRVCNDHGPADATPREFLPRSLSERAAEFGGTVAVSLDPHYTEVVVTLPLLGAIG